jgi:hypothetical protein
VDNVNMTLSGSRLCALVLAGAARVGWRTPGGSKSAGFMSALLGILVMASTVMAGHADEVFPVLQAGGKSYTNVLVTEKTATDLFISCSQGLVTVKVRDLDEATRLRLGYAAPIRVQAAPAVSQAIAPPEKSWRTKAWETLQRHEWLATILVLSLAGLSWLFSSRQTEQTEDEGAKGPWVQQQPQPAAAADASATTVENFPLRDFTSLTRHGHKMQERYRGHQKVCDLCQSEAVSQVQAYLWVARIEPHIRYTPLHLLVLLAGYIWITVSHTVVDFQTTHCLCKACVARTRIRRMFSVAVKWVAIFALLISLGVTTISGVVLLCTGFDREVARVLGCGVVGLVFSSLGQEWARRLRIPASFRDIGRRPFWLSRVEVMIRCEQTLKPGQPETWSVPRLFRGGSVPNGQVGSYRK